MSVLERERDKKDGQIYRPESERNTKYCKATWRENLLTTLFAREFYYLFVNFLMFFFLSGNKFPNKKFGNKIVDLGFFEKKTNITSKLKTLFFNLFIFIYFKKCFQFIFFVILQISFILIVWLLLFLKLNITSN